MFAKDGGSLHILYSTTVFLTEWNKISSEDKIVPVDCPEIPPPVPVPVTVPPVPVTVPVPVIVPEPVPVPVIVPLPDMLAVK